MTPRPLTTLLDAEPGCVAFGRDGREFDGQQLIRRVADINAQLSAHAGSRWALFAGDSFNFACALLACWSAGKTPVLVPDPRQLPAWRDALALDGVIADAGAAQRPASRRPAERPTRPFADLPIVALSGGSRIGDKTPATGTSAPTLAIPPDAELVLFTSGSTGEPKRIQKRLPHLQAELNVLEALWGETVGDAPVHATVSHQHIYGLLFRVLWPLATQRPFAAFDLEFPEQLLSGVADGAVLISSPALLKRLGFPDDAATVRWRAVFSSGGLLPPEAAIDATRLLATCPIEVLGSTETGGVGWRVQHSSAPVSCWQPLPGVRIRSDDDDYLNVSSDFVSAKVEADGWFRMGDLVDIHPDGRFELRGRGDRVIKIEDKRASLTEIEQALIAHDWIADAAAQALTVSGRQQVGAVLVLSAAGSKALATAGRAGFGSELRRALRERLEPIVIPRRFRYVDVIPVSPQGKREHSAIERLLRSRS